MLLLTTLVIGGVPVYLNPDALPGSWETHHVSGGSVYHVVGRDVAAELGAQVTEEVEREDKHQ
jgi:hypothetical protein